MRANIIRGFLLAAGFILALMSGGEAGACCHKKRSGCGGCAGGYAAGRGHAGSWGGGYPGWGYGGPSGQTGGPMYGSVGAYSAPDPYYTFNNPQNYWNGNVWAPSGYNPTGYTVNSPGQSFVQGMTAGAVGMPNPAYTNPYGSNGWSGGNYGTPYNGGYPTYSQSPAGYAGYRLGRRIFRR